MMRFAGTRGLVLAAAVALGLVAARAVTAQAQPDKYQLKEPNGIAFAEFRGYEGWQAVAPSYRTDKKEVRLVLGNDKLIKAFQAGIPLNGKPFPDGAMLVKIGYSERKHEAFGAALEPETLQRTEFMVKDAKRFARTSGWGYARFLYDAKTGSFTPYGKDALFDQECADCHAFVAKRDFVFTQYAPR